MPSDFGEGWVSSPIERWMIILLKSGALFWIGGFAAWALHTDVDLAGVWEEFMAGDIKPVQALLLIFILLVALALVASILKRFDLFVLRLLEGYWPLPLRSWWVKMRDGRIRERRDELVKLEKEKRAGPLSFKKQAKHAKLDWEFVHIPNRTDERMPTRLGNILHSMELYPQKRYGLNAFVCWPRLWLLLPEHVRQELVRARHNLDVSARIWTWSMLFTIWGVWEPLATPAGLLVSLFAYRWILQAAIIYGQLVKSAFDLHRFALYESLRWPIPDIFENEQEEGNKLSNYLFRNFVEKPRQNSGSKIIITQI